MSAVDRVLERLDRVKRSGDGWTARCPSHQDRNASLSVGVGDDGRVLVRCHRGCEVAAIVREAGLELRDLFDRDERPSAPRPATHRARFVASDEGVRELSAKLLASAAVLARLEELRGWTPTALDRAGVGVDGDRVTFPYRNSDGELVGLARYAPNPKSRNGGPKTKADAGSRRDLFPPPETLPAGGGWLFVTEGEPDALRLLSCGLDAVGVPGVNGWRHEFAGRFRGRRVVVCFDCDTAGREAAERAAAALSAAAIDVRVLDLDKAAEDGYDLSDFLAPATTPGEREEARRLLLDVAESAPRFYSGSKGSALPQRNGAAAGLPFGTLASKLENVPAEPAWEWDGYLARGAVTLLAGRPKVGKSTLLFALLAAIAGGRPFLDRPTRDGGVLLLSEERQGTLADKAQRFALGDRVHLLMRHESGYAEWVDVVAEAAAYCERHDLAVLVVDVLDKWAGYRGDGENNAGDVNAAVAPLAAAAASGLAVLLVVHHRKASGLHGEAVRGSNALTGAVDVVVELDRPGADVLAPDGSRVLRAVSRWQSTPDELVARLDGDHYTAEGTTTAVRADAERERVLEAVEDLGDATVKQVASDDVSERAARRHLDELVAARRLERLGEGKRGDPFRWRPVSLRQGESLGAGNESEEPGEAA